MEPLTWATAAQLIITIGIPATEKIIANWTNKTPVTLEEFAKLRALSEQTASDRMRAQLVAANIDLESVEAIRLLKLSSQ